MPSRAAGCNINFLRTSAIQDDYLIESLLRVTLREVEGIGAHYPSLQGRSAARALVQQHAAHAAQHAGVPRKEAACMRTSPI